MLTPKAEQIIYGIISISERQNYAILYQYGRKDNKCQKPYRKKIMITRRTCSITSLISGKRLTESITKDCGQHFRSVVSITN